MTEKKQIRLDQLLCDRGLAESREMAKRLILEGKALVDGEVRDKPGSNVPSNALLELKKDKYRFVSRGGEKLAHLIESQSINSDKKTCADIGASTGGFTDCLLQKGAVKVYAIDVGHAQLHEKLTSDPRVIVMDRINARYLTVGDLPEEMDIITIDVSFISLTHIIPAALNLLGPTGIVIALVKPQFEARRSKVPKSGVVKDTSVHDLVLSSLTEFIRGLGCEITAIEPSVLTGAKGNQEYFIVFHRHE